MYVDSYCNACPLRLTIRLLGFVELDQVLHVFLATKENGAALVDARRLDVENALRARGSKTTGLRNCGQYTILQFQ